MGSFGALVSFTFGVMLPTIRQDLDLNALQAGMLASITWITSAVTALPFGVWFSRYNPVKLVAVTAVLAAACAALQAFAVGFLTLLAARFLFVLLQAMKNPAGPLIMRRWLALRDVAWANGLGFSAHSVMQALAVSVIALVVTALGGWRQTYVAMGAMLGLFTIVWMLVAPERRGGAVQEHAPDYAEEKVSLLIAFRHRQVWLLGLAMVGPGIQWTALVTFFPSYLRDDRGISLAVAGLSTGLLWWGVALSGAIAGPADRFVKSKKVLIAGSGLLFVATGVGILLVSSVFWISVLGFALGVGWVIQPIASTVPFHLPGVRPRELAVLSAFIMMCVGVSFATGSLLAGFIKQVTGSLFIALLVPSLLCVGTVVVGLLYPEVRGTADRRDEASGERAARRRPATEPS
jgi:ACS family D-galactonate transporter-like MFS transporter